MRSETYSFEGDGILHQAQSVTWDSSGLETLSFELCLEHLGRPWGIGISLTCDSVRSETNKVLLRGGISIAYVALGLEISVI